jgi:hypothetical protein
MTRGYADFVRASSQISGGSVTVTRFDALVVDQLGLADVASHVQSVGAAAGLKPPAQPPSRT